MGSCNIDETKVPVIDFEDFPAQSQKLIEACEEWGCARIVNCHSILPVSLMSEMKQVVRSLFDLPQEIKERNKHILPISGYVPPNVINPFYESMGMYDMSSPQDVETFCTQLDASPSQRETMMKYTKAAHEVIMEIGRKFGEGLGLTKGDVFEGWASQLRIIKYHFRPENMGSTGLATHTDAAVLTLLHDDECVGGLQVMTKSGELVAVDPLPGSVLLIIGDAAVIWSNGKFHNAKHRVVCKDTDAADRFTIASFLLGPNEAAIEAPPELLGPDRKRLYVPATFHELRKIRVDNNLHNGEILELVRAKP
ncbi:unnamed protein product [Cuscuta europaea]|uniref:feruloyl-CoA 6-hydroxylase n=1 Tax=Cuscuta europaea TaxID=41803 RepID=A0A9P1EFN1_CUSEU|nr:unnamed protein product [Cuscuta europaea]